MTISIEEMSEKCERNPWKSRSTNSLGAHLSSELVDYSKSRRPPLLRLSQRSLEYGTMSTDKKDRTAGNLTNISSYASNII